MKPEDKKFLVNVLEDAVIYMIWMILALLFGWGLVGLFWYLAG